MANIYNSNRLQFVHCDTLFATREDAKAYVGGQLIEIDRPALYAEPMVLKYGDEKNPNILLAIGSVGDGETKTTNNKVFYIDLAHVDESIEEILDVIETMGGDIAAMQAYVANVINSCGFDKDGKYVASENEVIKSATSLMEADNLLAERIIKNTVNVKDSSSVDMSIDATEEGLVVSADVTLAPSKTVDNIVLPNILLSEENGIFAYVDVKFNKETDILTLNVNGKKVEYQLPHEVHLKSGKYNKTTEAIELTLNNDEVISVAVSELIDEWGVLDANAQDSPIVLSKTHVGYEADIHGNTDYRDILSADVRIATVDEQKYNILKRDATNNRYLYVDGTAKNITYFKNGEEVSVQEAIDNIKCEASNHDGNIVSVKNDGVFASVEVSYDAAKNVLTFNNGINGGKEIALNSAQIIDDIYYDASAREVVIKCSLTDGSKNEVRIQVDDILTTFDVDNTKKTVTLVSETKDSKTYLSADVNISKIKDNILVNDDNSLYVKGTADNIQYNEKDTVYSILATLDGTVDTVGSVRNLINLEKEARIKSDEANIAVLNALSDDLKASDAELDGKIDSEIEARKNEENARKEAIATLEAKLATEEASRTVADNALTIKIDNIDSQVQTKLEASEKALTAEIEKTATVLSAQIAAVDTKVNTLDEKISTEIATKVNELETLVGTEVDKLSHQVEDVTSELTAQMSELNTTISSNLEVAKADLTKSIESEAAERKGADEVLTNNIANVIASLNEEKVARQAVESDVKVNSDAIVAEREARMEGDANLHSAINAVIATYEAVDVQLSQGIETNTNMIKANTEAIAEVKAMVEEKANSISTKETATIQSILEDGTLSANVKINQSQGGNIIKVLSDGLYADVTVRYDAATSKLTFDNGIVSESWTIASNSLVKNAYYTQDGRLVLEIENSNGSVEQIEVKIDRIEGGSKVNSPITVNVETTDAGTRMITADIAVSNHEHNGITIDGGLFMSNHASDIYGSYKSMSSDLQTIITAIQEDMPPATLEDEVRDLASAVRGSQGDIDDMKDEMRDWDKTINTLANEITRLSTLVADLQSQIDNIVDFGTCTVVDITATPETPEEEVTPEDENNVEA